MGANIFNLARSPNHNGTALVVCDRGGRCEKSSDPTDRRTTAVQQLLLNVKNPSVSSPPPQMSRPRRNLSEQWSPNMRSTFDW